MTRDFILVMESACRHIALEQALIVVISQSRIMLIISRRARLVWKSDVCSLIVVQCSKHAATCSLTINILVRSHLHSDNSRSLRDREIRFPI